MKILDRGHRYQLQILDSTGTSYHELQFVKREGEKYPGNVGTYEGTNCQEVLRACVDRLLYLNKQIPHEETHLAVLNIKGAIYCLERRAAMRHGRDPDMSIDEAVYGETCDKCGHVGCKGSCHG